MLYVKILFSSLIFRHTFLWLVSISAPVRNVIKYIVLYSLFSQYAFSTLYWIFVRIFVFFFSEQIRRREISKILIVISVCSGRCIYQVQFSCNIFWISTYKFLIIQAYDYYFHVAPSLLSNVSWNKCLFTSSDNTRTKRMSQVATSK